jgi:hypothetical protein
LVKGRGSATPPPVRPGPDVDVERGQDDARQDRDGEAAERHGNRANGCQSEAH